MSIYLERSAVEPSLLGTMNQSWEFQASVPPLGTGLGGQAFGPRCLILGPGKNTKRILFIFSKLVTINRIRPVQFHPWVVINKGLLFVVSCVDGSGTQN